jgi:beta-glucanase (GH16 family)
MPKHTAPPPADPKVLFYDDFDGDELDRSQWNVHITGTVYNQEQQAYVDSPETLYLSSGEEALGTYHGALIIHPRYRPGFVSPQGQRFDFISGRIDTRAKFDFTCGTAAARIKLPAGIGVWPAFWALGYGQWPDTGEIDILEYVGEPDWVSAAAHGPGYFGETGLVNRFYFPPAEDAAGWHIYAVDWQPDQLHFTVDGRTIYRITRPMIDFVGPWVFDVPEFLILNLALGGVYPFKTNGIRNPYFGLPAATVRLIQEDRVRLAVDWVQISGS